jgi:hypothetical protein
MKKVKISLALTAFCAVMISVSALAQKSQKFTFANSKMIEKNEWTGKSVKVEGELIGKINVQDMGSLGYTETLVFVQDKGKEVIITNVNLMGESKKKLDLYTLTTTTVPKGISNDLIFKNSGSGVYNISLDSDSDATLKSEVTSIRKELCGKYEGRQSSASVGPFNSEADLEKFKSRFK